MHIALARGGSEHAYTIRVAVSSMHSVVIVVG
jgi:hypothetical protein